MKEKMRQEKKEAGIKTLLKNRSEGDLNKNLGH